VPDTLYDRREPSGFALLERTGEIRSLVNELPAASRRLFCVMSPTDRGVVLGSSQPSDDLDEQRCTAEGYRISRRRSGGGAVVVDPATTVWIDLFVPTHDPQWLRDVGEASYWVGELWRRAIDDLTVTRGNLAVHRGPLIRSPWSDSCCFAGLGPGEVVNAERKVVGLSQRRTRAGAWFFTTAYIGGDPASTAELFSLDDTQRSGLATALANGVETLSTTRKLLIDALIGAARHI
jgi:lipoate-protein ligase A